MTVSVMLCSVFGAFLSWCLLIGGSGTRMIGWNACIVIFNVFNFILIIICGWCPELDVQVCWYSYSDTQVSLYLDTSECLYTPMHWSSSLKFWFLEPVWLLISDHLLVTQSLHVYKIECPAVNTRSMLLLRVQLRILVFWSFDALA